MDIGQTIINLQNNQDDLLHGALSTQTCKIRQIQQDISTLNDSLAALRRKSKSGANRLDLSEAEPSIRRAADLYESLKEQYPFLINDSDSLFPAEMNFASAEIEHVEKMMDVIANVISQKQSEIPEVTQMLKMATDLNEIISKLIQEMAKEHKRASRAGIDNMVRG